MRTIYLEKDIPRMLLVKALRPLWPGVVFSSLSPTRLADLPEPALPGPHWLRVRNRLAGICGSDLHLIHIEADPRIALAPLPGGQISYLGHEVVGEVTEAGAESGFQPGERVVLDNMGGNCLSQEITPACRHCQAGNLELCENASLNLGPARLGGGWGDGFTSHKTGVYRVPAALDDDAAVMIEPLSVGVHAALRRLPASDERALIVGAGVIGLGLLQALRALSPHCHVTVMARHPHQIEAARRLGADEIIGREDAYAAVARLTGAKLYAGMFQERMLLGGFDVIFDCVGSATTLRDSLRWARAGGAVVLVGAHFAPLRVDLTPVWYQEVNLIGTFAHGVETWQGAKIHTYDLTMQLLQAGKLSIAGLITHRFPLERWTEAVRTAMDKRSGVIKVVLELAPH